jgi:undecaprenyl diphosphate synthase
MDKLDLYGIHLGSPVPRVESKFAVNQQLVAGCNGPSRPFRNPNPLSASLSTLLITCSRPLFHHTLFPHLLFRPGYRSLCCEKMVNQVPKHVAIIMDGNGRWARQRGWPRSRGHLEGAKAVRACVETCLELGVLYLTLYAFSTENWQRPKEEVDTLMGLLRKFLRDYTRDLAGQGIQLQAIGRLTELPQDCQEQLREAIAQTANNHKLTTILAVNYSGRAEIIDGVKRVAQEIKANRLDPDALTAEKFSQFLYTHQWPDPDLLIRTSGEMRISNFLLWQLSYTEMYVTQTLWPDFKREDLLEAVAEFNRRQRRYGGV